MVLPESIQEYIRGKKYRADEIGMSDSQVLLFDDMVLKIEKRNPGSDNEHRMMKWLQGRLPVPEVLVSESADGVNYLLMSRLEGSMACAPENMRQPEKTVELLAEGIRMLRTVDLSDLPHPPTLNGTDVRLEEARLRIEQGTAPDDGKHIREFGSAEKAFEWLLAHRPKDEIVFSHGDYCLPNVLFCNGRVSGFLDLGQCGAADAWYDISQCQNSLYNNFNGVFDGVTWPGWKKSMLPDALGIENDEETVRFHLLLDNLL